MKAHLETQAFIDALTLALDVVPNPHESTKLEALDERSPTSAISLGQAGTTIRCATVNRHNTITLIQDLEAVVIEPGSCSITTKTFAIDGALTTSRDPRVEIEAIADFYGYVPRARVTAGPWIITDETQGEDEHEAAVSEALRAKDSARFVDLDPTHRADIVSAIDAILHAVSRDRARINLYNGLLARADDAWELVGTDGHRIARRVIRAPLGPLCSSDLLIPRPGLRAIADLLRRSPARPARVGRLDHHIIIVEPSATLVVQRGRAKFPEWRAAVPPRREVLVEVEFETRALLDFLDAAKAVVRGKHEPIRLEVTEGRVMLRMRDPILRATCAAMLPCTVNVAGDVPAIGLSPTYLRDALTMLGGKDVQIAISRGGTHSPVTLRDPQRPSECCWVMPMMLEA